MKLSYILYTYKLVVKGEKLTRSCTARGVWCPWLNRKILFKNSKNIFKILHQEQFVATSDIVSQVFPEKKVITWKNSDEMTAI